MYEIDYSKRVLNDLFEPIVGEEFSYSDFLISSEEVVFIYCRDTQKLARFFKDEIKRFYILLDKEIKSFGYTSSNITAIKSDLSLPNMIITTSELYSVAFCKSSRNKDMVQAANSLFRYLFMKYAVSMNGYNITHDNVLSTSSWVVKHENQDFLNQDSTIVVSDKEFGKENIVKSVDFVKNDFDFIIDGFDSVDYLDLITDSSLSFIIKGECYYQILTDITFQPKKFSRHVYHKAVSISQIFKRKYYLKDGSEVKVMESDIIKGNLKVDLLVKNNPDELKKQVDAYVLELSKTHTEYVVTLYVDVNIIDSTLTDIQSKQKLIPLSEEDMNNLIEKYSTLDSKMKVFNLGNRYVIVANALTDEIKSLNPQYVIKG